MSPAAARIERGHRAEAPNRAALRERLRRHLASHGLKSTTQRDIIVDTLLSAKCHISVDDLTRSVKKRAPHVGAATVYRTLRLLSECGVVVGRRFGDGEMRYEVDDGESHHDHLICDECGRIVEFEDDRVEDLQEAIARRYGFKLDRHRHELYGLCRECAR